MKVETIADVLTWTEKFHQHLGDYLKDCIGNQQDERARLIMSYIVDHEKQLVHLLAEFNHRADAKVLNTWCVEYFDKNEGQLRQYDACDEPYDSMNANDIFASVMQQHDEVIELYRYLLGRVAQTEEVYELVEEVLQTEEHETMRMAQANNRLFDL